MNDRIFNRNTFSYSSFLSFFLFHSFSFFFIFFFFLSFISSFFLSFVRIPFIMKVDRLRYRLFKLFPPPFLSLPARYAKRAGLIRLNRSLEPDGRFLNSSLPSYPSYVFVYLQYYFNNDCPSNMIASNSSCLNIFYPFDCRRPD